MLVSITQRGTRNQKRKETEARLDIRPLLVLWTTPREEKKTKNCLLTLTQAQCKGRRGRKHLDIKGATIVKGIHFFPSYQLT